MKIMLLIVLMLCTVMIGCIGVGMFASVKLLNHFTHEGKNARNLKLFDNWHLVDLIKFW